ncbi:MULTISPECIES: hypothetical protein [Bacillaceae]|uniref:hypothetical protein n=1 Tax=Bacillaceae TaxID=186817 RepID=UPI0003789DA2|nr:MULTISPECIES: hypothetical protein [Bacillaceae]
MNHSYKSHEGTELWSKVNQIIEDLIGNQDIEETATREHIVGYICENLVNEFKKA